MCWHQHSLQLFTLFPSTHMQMPHANLSTFERYIDTVAWNQIHQRIHYSSPPLPEKKIKKNLPLTIPEWFVLRRAQVLYQRPGRDHHSAGVCWGHYSHRSQVDRSPQEALFSSVPTSCPAPLSDPGTFQVLVFPLLDAAAVGQISHLANFKLRPTSVPTVHFPYSQTIII